MSFMTCSDKLLEKYKCRLCDSETGVLRKSHLYPKFAFKWLRETSPTGLFRSSTGKKSAVQDGPKFRWLCSDCELVLSKDEAHFSREVFVPYCNALTGKKYSELDISGKMFKGEWLLRFAVGLQFRNLIYHFETLSCNGEVCLPYYETIIETLDSFRQFLLSKRNHTGRNETHMIFYKFVKMCTFPAAPNYHMYALRSCDLDIISMDNKRQTFIFTKIGPIAFYTQVSGKAFRSINTRICLKKNFVTINQKIKNKDLAYFFVKDRPHFLLPLMTKYSSKEKSRIIRRALKDPKRYRTSFGAIVRSLDKV